VLLVLLTTVHHRARGDRLVHAVDKRQREFYASLLALETGMLGTFLALDLLLFYVFWEAMLVPMYLLIGVWGGPRRVYAAIKFFLYTMAGQRADARSRSCGSTSTSARSPASPRSRSTRSTTAADGGGSSAGCSWRSLSRLRSRCRCSRSTPWLPDAHVEAPTAGSVILAGRAAQDGHVRLRAASRSRCSRSRRTR
jgi:NADH-quinone oxidoreductase subunit M